MKLKSSFSNLLSDAGQMVILSILWAVCSLPMFTAGPASAALYYCVVKVVRRDLGNALTDFFRVFKENFGQGVWYTMIFLSYYAVIFYFWLTRYSSLSSFSADYFFYVLVSFAVFGSVFLLWCFPILSRFDNKGAAFFRFLLYISVRYIHFTIIFGMLFLASVYICVSNSAFLIIIPAVYDLIISFMIEPVFRAHSNKDNKMNYNMWYSPYAGEDITDDKS